MVGLITWFVKESKRWKKWSRNVKYGNLKKNWKLTSEKEAIILTVLRSPRYTFTFLLEE